MKKIYSLLLIGLLAGCSNSNIDTDIKIMCPTGAPSLAFYNYALDKNFETNSTPDNITSLMTSRSPYTVVVIDTVSGIESIRNGAPYKIAANITFGNFYIVSTGQDEDSVMSEGDNILIFGKNKTPDYLFKYLYPNLYSSLKWVDGINNVKEELTNPTQNIDYAFIAEPALSALKVNNVNEYKNIQEEFYQKSGVNLVQASIFIKNSLSIDVANQFLDSLKSDIETGLANPNKIQEGLNKLNDPTKVASVFGVPSALAKTITENGNRMGLGFKKASDNKNSIDQLLEIFGKETSNESYYF